MKFGREQLVPVLRATGSITDPDFFVAPFAEDVGPTVVARDTKLELFGGRVVLLFSGSRFISLIPEPQERFPYYLLLHYIKYRSRVNYSVVWPEQLGVETETIEASPTVVFRMLKLVEVPREERIDGEIRQYLDSEATPHEFSIGVDEIEALLRVSTPQLYLAMAYYLIGCENSRYFLIEFYKALEAIKNGLGGEAAAIVALKDFGLSETEFKKVKRYANDRRAPFDIGRHAPGRDVRLIDIRPLLDRPLGRTVFRECVVATRQAIDAYFARLRANAGR